METDENKETTMINVAMILKRNEFNFIFMALICGLTMFLTMAGKGTTA